MSTAAEVRQYQMMVESAMQRALETGVPEVFENEGPNHARTTVDVVSASLDGRIWSSDHIRRFTERSPDTRMRILLSDYNSNTPKMSALHELLPNEHIMVHRLPLRLDAHFTIVDGRHTRLEHDCVSRGAYVTFGDPAKTGASLQRLFNKIWDKAVSLAASPSLFDTVA